MTTRNRKVFIKTWGCQMNVYDSARIADVLAPHGYEQVQDAQEADLVIFNTCHIREKASEKLFSELGRLRAVQKERESIGLSMTIAVGGCVAQAEGDEIKRRAPYVDIVFGPQTYHHLPEMLARAYRASGGVVETDFPEEPKFDFLPDNSVQNGVSAFLAIQEGCDRFCSYCVVPYTRGAEYSRPFQSILDEADRLIELGAREITLLGQNVNAYQDDKSGKGLADLIEALATRNNLFRIRYTTSHPLDMSDRLITAHRDIEKLMPFLHLPIQSGSNAILEAMNRQHTATDYLRIIEKLRKARPDLALSSDFIVGFPGETDKDFQDTMNVVREVGYAQAFSFKYSRRPGTPAAMLKNQVSEDIKNSRLAELQAILRDQQIAFNKLAQDKVMSILFENYNKERGHLFGRTPYLQAVRVPTEQASLTGLQHNVLITRTYSNSLNGLISE